MEKEKEKKKEFSPEDLEIAELPEREAMSLININGNKLKVGRLLKFW